MISEFYAVAAQVLPVLFLAVAVEFQYLSPSKEELQSWPEADRPNYLAQNAAVGLGLVLTVALGEFAALRVVKEEESMRYADGLITLALAALGLVLLIQPLINAIWTQEVVEQEEGKEKAAREGKSYEHTLSSRWEWGGLLQLVAFLATLATPLYGLWALAHVVL